jgi:phenylpyruvate tautomerase PptA (4-oxalocrotonate tautomerase family)
LPAAPFAALREQFAEHRSDGSCAFVGGGKAAPAIPFNNHRPDRKTNMPMISCDMRYGRTDEQKRALSAGLLRVVSEATGEPPDNIFFVIREGRGINFVEHGKHLPELSKATPTTKT